MIRASLAGRPRWQLRSFSTTRTRWNDARKAVNAAVNVVDRMATSAEPGQHSAVSGPSSSTASSSPPSAASSSSGPSSSASSSTSSSATPEDLEAVRQRIREWSDQAAISFRSQADGWTAATRRTFSQLGSELNKVTGYEEIEALKRKVVNMEARIAEIRASARQAKAEYERAVNERSSSQRKVNDMLMRKSLWTDADVSAFTTLVREDHTLEQDEARAKTAVDAAEATVEREFGELLRVILARYHEEQVWSDKIRSASTYGQLAALALNLIVFLSAVMFVEPWKRKRLAQTFEKKVEELSGETKAVIEKRVAGLQEQLAVYEILLMKNDVARTSPGGTGSLEQAQESRLPSSKSIAHRVATQDPVPLVIVGGVAAAAASLLTWLVLGR